MDTPSTKSTSNTGTTPTPRLKKTRLVPLDMARQYTMTMPAIFLEEAKLQPEEELRTSFLRHLDKQASDTQVYAEITKLQPDAYDVTVACDCGCEHSLTRRVTSAGEAWTEVHVMNEQTNRVLILAHFVKGE